MWKFTPLLASVLFLSACSISQMSQKAYVPITPQVLCFDGDRLFKGAIFMHYNQMVLQAAWKQAGHFGVCGSLALGTARHYGEEFGVAWFGRKGDTVAWEVQTGLGVGIVDAHSGGGDNLLSTALFLPYQKYFDSDIRARYYRFYLQPTLRLNDERLSIDLIGKVNAVFYRNYDYRYDLRDHQTDTNSDQDVPVAHDEVHLHDRVFLLAEPTICFRTGNRRTFNAKWQLTGVFPLNPYRSRPDLIVHGQVVDKQKFLHPAVCYFYPLFGVEIFFGKKK